MYKGTKGLCGGPGGAVQGCQGTMWRGHGVCAGLPGGHAEGHGHHVEGRGGSGQAWLEAHAQLAAALSLWPFCSRV